MSTHDKAWMSEQTGKTVDWITRHLDEIPHHKLGQPVRFTEADLAAYLEQTAVTPNIMRHAGRRKRGGWAS